MVVVSSREEEIVPTINWAMRLVGREKGMRRCNDGRGCHEKRCRRVELHGRMMVQITISFFDLWIEHLALYKLLLLTVVLLLLEATGMGGFRLVFMVRRCRRRNPQLVEVGWVKSYRNRDTNS